MAQLNLSKKGFSCDKNETNKPIEIIENHLKQKNIKMSAAEMLCFVNNLSFLIVHLIGEHNIHWSLFLILKRIIIIVTSKKIHVNAHYLLEIEIQEYLQLSSEIFSQNMIPNIIFLSTIP